MYSRVLVTEGGPHPAADWARVTCEDLVPLDGLPQNLASAGMVLRGRMVEVLTEHYEAAQNSERSALRSGPERFVDQLVDVEDFGQLFAELQAAASGTPWEGHITGPEVIDAIRLVITQHAQHLRHVERLCHADSNPNDSEGQAYRARHGLPPSPRAQPSPAAIALPAPGPEA